MNSQSSEHRLMECLKDLVIESESVFLHLEKIEPYENHEMGVSTPNPDIYWDVLEKAKNIINENL